MESTLGQIVEYHVAMCEFIDTLVDRRYEKYVPKMQWKRSSKKSTYGTKTEVIYIDQLFQLSEMT